jgi:hypothetical protein
VLDREGFRLPKFERSPLMATKKFIEVTAVMPFGSRRGGFEDWDQRLQKAFQLTD